MVPSTEWYSGGQKKISNSYFYAYNKINTASRVLSCADTVLDMQISR